MSYKELFDNAYMTIKAADRYEARLEKLYNVINRYADQCLPRCVAATFVDGVYYSARCFGFDGLDQLQECIQLLDSEPDLDSVTNRLHKDWVNMQVFEQEPLASLIHFLNYSSEGFGETEDIPDFIQILHHPFGLMSMLLSMCNINETMVDVVYNIKRELDLFWRETDVENISQFCDVADSLHTGGDT